MRFRPSPAVVACFLGTVLFSVGMILRFNRDLLFFIACAIAGCLGIAIRPLVFPPFHRWLLKLVHGTYLERDVLGKRPRESELLDQPHAASTIARNALDVKNERVSESESGNRVVKMPPIPFLCAICTGVFVGLWRPELSISHGRFKVLLVALLLAVGLGVIMVIREIVTRRNSTGSYSCRVVARMGISSLVRCLLPCIIVVIAGVLLKLPTDEVIIMAWKPSASYVLTVCALMSLAGGFFDLLWELRKRGIAEEDARTR